MKTTVRVIFVTGLLVGLGVQNTASNASRLAQAEARQQDPGGRVTIRAAGRGTPWLNLLDGVDLDAGATAGHSALLGSAQARSVAAGDFHEDGSTDLIAGYAGANGGFVVLHRGTPEAHHWPFPSARVRRTQASPDQATSFSAGPVFSVPAAPDFLAAGDFNCDGHKDVVIAARGGDALYLLPGDGHGDFGPAERIALPGEVTALVTGEINRADGLEDVVVAVNGAEGPQVLVFESQRGALRDEPEVFSLPAPATALALGRLAGNYTFDLAVAAGENLLIIEGRDRKMYLDAALRGSVPEARINRLALPFSVASMSEGYFQGDYQSQLALLSEDGEIHLVRRSNPENSRTGVSKMAPRFEVSLLAPATGNRPSHLVRARISTSGVDDLVLLDGPGRNLHLRMGGRAAGALASLETESAPVAVLPMQWKGTAKSGLVVFQAASSAPTVVPLISNITLPVTNTMDSGPGSLRSAISFSNSIVGFMATVTFNIPPTDPNFNNGAPKISLLSPLPAITKPITIDGSSQPGFVGEPLIEINGSLTTSFNFPTGLHLSLGSDRSTIQGLAVTGFSDSNGMGAGIILGSSNNTVSGCAIGTNAAGGPALGNGTGIFFVSSSGNAIVGNAIAGNREGVDADAGSMNNIIQGNDIGLNPTIGAPLANGVGVLINGAMNTTVGGFAFGQGNTISGNTGNAIKIMGGATGTLIQGNKIGTDPFGRAAGNGLGGVFIDSSANNTVGGMLGFGNTIVANGGDGVLIMSSASMGNLLEFNFIGTTINAIPGLGNAGEGIHLAGAPSTVIGAAGMPRSGGVISGNLLDGITIDLGADNATVQDAEIGTDLFGTLSIPNGGSGISSQGNHTMIMGSDIWDNGNDGFKYTYMPFIDDVSLGNSFFQNKGVGININNVRTPITPCGGITVPTNPGVLRSAVVSGSNLILQGTANEEPNTNFLVQFFVNPTSDPNEAMLFVGQVNGTTDSACNMPYTLIVPAPSSQFVTATVTITGLKGTSEISAPITISQILSPISFTFPNVQNGQSLTQTIVLTANLALTPSTASITAGGLNFKVATGPPTTPVAQNGTFPIGLTFAPNGVGSFTGNLIIATNLGNSNITLTGMGTDAPPTITTPGNITVPATGQLTAVSYVVTANDLEDGPLTPSCAPFSGAPFGIGTTTVNCSVTDSASLTATASFTVTVIVGNPQVAVSVARAGPGPNGTRAFDLTWRNVGTGTIVNLLDPFIFRTLSGTGTVTYNTALSPPLPIALGNLTVGASKTVRIFLNVPTTVTRFSITENGSFQNVLGTKFNYSVAQATTP